MAKNERKDYQALSLELEQLLNRLQQSDIRVDEAVKLYEEGLALVAELEAHLQQAENTIEQLKLAAAKEA
jgi:exodeoxyribonuclease VII small subunit